MIMIRIFPLGIATALGVISAWVAPLAKPLMEEKQFFNKSGQPWKLTLVQGARETEGTMQFIDKFTGKRHKILARVGDSITLPPGSRYMVAFVPDRAYVYNEFIIQDARGDYVEYSASIPYRSNPQLNLQITDHHVGGPLNLATDEVIRGAIDEAIATDNGNLLILQDFIVLTPRPAGLFGAS
jgi:hypothetical protein